MLLVFVDAVNQFGITFFHRFDQFRDLLRRALQVVVKGNDIITFGVIETAESSAVLPEVLGQADDSDNIRSPFLILIEHFPACVMAAIIHENNLKAFPGTFQNSSEPAEQFLQRGFAVKHWNYDRKFHFFHRDEFRQR